MDASIRRATLTDLPQMADLLLRDAQLRSVLEPTVWRVADDARARIEAAVADREFLVERIWTCDSIIGFMFSTSIASRRVLGNNAGNFEADLRAALLEYEPADRFVSQQRFGFTVGTKDGADA